MPVPDRDPLFYRHELYWTAGYTFLLGLLLGLTVMGRWESPWTMLRVGGIFVVLILTLRRSKAGLPAWPRPKSYPINPDDVAHFSARQEERKLTIGHE